jgi:hypothetical protein
MLLNAMAFQPSPLGQPWRVFYSDTLWKSLIEAEKAKGRRILALWPGATFKEHLKKV